MNVFLSRLIKPLLNQRGMAGEGEPPDDGIERDENGFIKGTSYKTMAELHKGHLNLNDLHTKQADELGSLRGQAKTLAETLKATLENKGAAPAGPAPAAGPDYAKEIASVNAELEKLDPMDDGFVKKNKELVNRLTDLKASAVKDQVLSTAGDIFKKELTNRDSIAAQKQFHKDNPTFNTPEMQKRIGDFLATDETGTHDTVSAFFKIQADDNALAANTALAERDKIKEILALQHGKDETGKVITKGQPPMKTNTGKVAGKDLIDGAKGVLRQLNGEA